MNSKRTLTFALVLGVFLNACENKEESNLFLAKNCVNKASKTTVNNCLKFISGQTSKSSYVVRCSAAFISQGIDDDAIIEAMRNIKGDKSGDPTAPTIAALAMSSPAAATTAVKNCSATESDSLTALANFANLSTAMIPLLGIAPPYTATAVEAAIDAYNNGGTVEDKEDLGNAVLNGQDSLCDKKTGMFKDSPVCKDIDAAVAANPGNAAAIADALIGKLKD